MSVNDSTSAKEPTVCGAQSTHVMLISYDGHEFIVPREMAELSNTIKSMMTGPFESTETMPNSVNLKDVPSHVLRKVCHYLAYKMRFTDHEEEIPEFEIAPEVALQLLMTSNFLDI
ncbi:unnamed protein product [Bursaphelenchus xylophilus]|uniref:Elongin-C n=1 Tax=Bursaphelenchus xylophilus TaxID=6326 RepID=A0A7I8X9K3_BURXY|nr:unnamed protein product [Bursaphelenchus xylophilus]CAG9132065.1 unnamed protein product [Bursaphelenchus xylophilus]